MIHGEGNKSTLVFSDEINAEYNFDIRSGEVTIYIDNDMTLTNEGLSRSAINIEPNAKLNLYISKDTTLTVNSGFGKDAERNDGEKLAEGGAGGYAGIRVPWIDSNNNEERDLGEQAELNLYGEGKLIAIGGNASIGGDCLKGDTGGAGRTDGAGARNRSVTGGQGGDAAQLWSEKSDGRDGENCGVVNINNTLNVEAYGGAGASSGVNLRDNSGDSGSGTGAGGYPGARNRSVEEQVGGAGCYINGGGGYSGGSCENDKKYAQYHNGKCETELSKDTANNYGDVTRPSPSGWERDSAGGGYFSKGVIGPDVLLLADVGCNVGGEGAALDSVEGTRNPLRILIVQCGKTGSGGYAGEGGIISVSSTSNVKAENGNECSLPEFNEDGTKNKDYYYKPLEIDIQKRNL